MVVPFHTGTHTHTVFGGQVPTTDPYTTLCIIVEWTLLYGGRVRHQPQPQPLHSGCLFEKVMT